MLDDVLRRLFLVLQHILDEVDSPARAVELVAQEDVGRTGRRAEAAVDAGPQDVVRDRRVGVLELLGREVRLHGRLDRWGEGGRYGVLATDWHAPARPGLTLC